MYACWSVKGGSGTTVFASALALSLAEQHGEASIIDLCGDVPSVLGMAEPAGRGIRDWLSSPDRDAQELFTMRVSATSRLHVIPAGSATSFDENSLEDLMSTAHSHPVVIDFGLLRPPASTKERRMPTGWWFDRVISHCDVQRDFTPDHVAWCC